MEFDCRCCGHTESPCDCPNGPDPFDVCYPKNLYGCPKCGRSYQISHHPSVSCLGETCLADCDGKLTKRFPTFQGGALGPFYGAAGGQSDEGNLNGA